jgi:hypothetical protein
MVSEVMVCTVPNGSAWLGGVSREISFHRRERHMACIDWIPSMLARGVSSCGQRSSPGKKGYSHGDLPHTRGSTRQEVVWRSGWVGSIGCKFTSSRAPIVDSLNHNSMMHANRPASPKTKSVAMCACMPRKAPPSTHIRGHTRRVQEDVRWLSA